MPTFLHVKEQLQGAQVPDMDPVDSTAHRLPTEVRVLPACCVIAAEARPTSPPPPTEEASGARHGAGTEWSGGACPSSELAATPGLVLGSKCVLAASGAERAAWLKY